MSTQPKPTGEWTTFIAGCWGIETSDSVICPAVLSKEVANEIADAHNAALAAERDKANVRETELICERDYFKKELDAERDNRKSIESINKSLARAVERLREQLAEEREEHLDAECKIAKLSDQYRAVSDQLAAAQWPLMDALKKIVQVSDLNMIYDLAEYAIKKVNKK